MRQRIAPGAAVVCVQREITVVSRDRWADLLSLRFLCTIIERTAGAVALRIRYIRGFCLGLFPAEQRFQGNHGGCNGHGGQTTGFAHKRAPASVERQVSVASFM